MMLSLKKVNRFASKWSLESISINSEFIVSMCPLVEREIREINDRAVSPKENYTSITYRTGASTKTIVVASEYSDILRQLGQKRVLLNG